jgi:hypothetical protein
MSHKTTRQQDPQDNMTHKTDMKDLTATPDFPSIPTMPIESHAKRMTDEDVEDRNFMEKYFGVDFGAYWQFKFYQRLLRMPHDIDFSAFGFASFEEADGEWRLFLQKTLPILKLLRQQFQMLDENLPGVTVFGWLRRKAIKHQAK